LWDAHEPTKATSATEARASDTRGTRRRNMETLQSGFDRSVSRFVFLAATVPSSRPGFSGRR
jgi:hypothetical protein